MGTQWLRRPLYALSPELKQWGLTHQQRATLALELFRPEDMHLSLEHRPLYGYVILSHENGHFQVEVRPHDTYVRWQLKPNGCVRWMGGINKRRVERSLPAVRGYTSGGWDPSKVAVRPGFDPWQETLRAALTRVAAVAVPLLTGDYQPGSEPLCRTCPNESLCLMTLAHPITPAK